MTKTQYITRHKDRFLQELKDFLCIPSISTTQQYTKPIHQAAVFIREKLLAAGASQAYLIDTQGNPLVYGEKIVAPHLPTVLVYGHYDVQPPGEESLWNTPPFEPTIKNGRIYARGASDDKSQVYLHIKALEVLLATNNLPCNLKFLIEGEEECGSKGLNHLLDDPRLLSTLQSDILLVSDTTLFSAEQPSLTISLRGIVCLEIELTGPNRDLHSGVYGGSVANPINILCQVLSVLHDKNYRIAIPGFYDAVHPLSQQEQDALVSLPFSLDQYKAYLGLREVLGEQGYHTLERVGSRPSLDINGIWGGYTQEGSKTVLPSKAYAKLSLRLVPGQEAADITEKCIDYIKTLIPEGVHISIHHHHEGSNAVSLSPHSIAMQAAQKAFDIVWHKTPLLTRSGGSIPIIATLQAKLHCDVVLMGFGLDSDAIHAANEHFQLRNFFKGITTVTTFYEQLAGLYCVS